MVNEITGRLDARLQRLLVAADGAHDEFGRKWVLEGEILEAFMTQHLDRHDPGQRQSKHVEPSLRGRVWKPLHNGSENAY